MPSPQIVANGLTRTVAHLRRSGVKVIFLRDSLDIAVELSEYCKLRSPLMKKDCTIPKSEFMRNRSAEDRLVRNLLNHYPDLIIVDPMDTFCDQENCFLMRNGVLYFRDQHHLGIAGSRMLATLLEKQLGP